MINEEEKNLLAMKAMKAKMTEKAQYVSGQEMPSGSNLEKVRDLLFGENIRESERKFSNIENKLRKETSELRDEMNKRFESLESYIKNEITDLSEQIRKESESREDAFKKLSEQIKENNHNFEKKVKQLEDSVSKSQRESRENILTQTQKLSDEIRKKYEELWSALQKEYHELHFRKTDKEVISNLFIELAMRLNDEFKVTDAHLLNGND
ncbi:MAG: hypothetical protein U0457_20455 [Candidatus Sericytochromatia bacterium]